MKETKQWLHVLLALFTLCAAVMAQNYHFSNGWEPGKRSHQICEFRPQIKNLILRIIGDEVDRLKKCYRGTGISQIFDFMQNKPAAVLPDEK